MHFDVVTLFAPMFDAVTQHGVSRRAVERGPSACSAGTADFAVDHCRTVDDRPYGGGPGMVMLPARWSKPFLPRERQQQSGLRGRKSCICRHKASDDHQLVMQLAAEHGWCCLPGGTRGRRAAHRAAGRLRTIDW